MNLNIIRNRQFTPESITELKENEIFVFGSNLNGSHAGGAARFAVEKFGAVEGQEIGIQGKSYAIPTLGKKMEKLSLEKISISIDNLYQFADENADLVFLVTKLGCGIAGFTEDEMKSVFYSKEFTPFNVVLPQEFTLIKGVKGFDKDMKCRDVQFEENKDFFQPGQIEACSNGFHFCENPLQVNNFYRLKDSEVCEVEGSGKLDSHESDSKVAVSNLKIKAKINLPALLEIGIEFTRKQASFIQRRAEKLIQKGEERANFTSGLNSSVNSGLNYSVNSGLDYSVNSGLDYSVNSGLDYSVNSGRNSSVNSGRNSSVNSGLDSSVNSGLDSSVNSGLDYSVNSGRNSSVNSGLDYSVNSGLDSSVNSGLDSSVNSGLDSSVNSGLNSSVCAGRYRSEINLNGTNSFGIAGKDSKIKGKIGCAICLVEHNDNNEIIAVKSALVDGIKIKEDTYYTIKNGKFVEVKSKK